MCLRLDIEDSYVRYKREGLLLFSGRRKVEAEEKEFSENQFPTFPSIIVLRHSRLGI
jgi:hypothetical protein